MLQEMHMAAKSLASCFDNVIIASTLEYVVYAGYTRLQVNMASDFIAIRLWKWPVSDPDFY